MDFCCKILSFQTIIVKNSRSKNNRYKNRKKFTLIIPNFFIYTDTTIAFKKLAWYNIFVTTIIGKSSRLHGKGNLSLEEIKLPELTSTPNCLLKVKRGALK